MIHVVLVRYESVDLKDIFCGEQEEAHVYDRISITSAKRVQSVVYEDIEQVVSSFADNVLNPTADHQPENVIMINPNSAYGMSLAVQTDKIN